MLMQHSRKHHGQEARTKLTELNDSQSDSQDSVYTTENCSMAEDVEESEDEQRPLLGRCKCSLTLLYMVLVTLTSVSSDAIFKHLVKDQSVFFLTLMRGVTMTTLILPVIIYNPELFTSTVKEWRLLSLRGTASSCSVTARVGALFFAPLGDVTAVTSVIPILSALWSVCVLSESIVCAEIVLALISTVGICLIAEPSASGLLNGTYIDYSLLFGVGLAVASALFGSLGYVFNRKLSNRDVKIHPIVQVFYYGVLSIVINSLGFGVYYGLTGSLRPPGVAEWGLLLLVGVLSLLKQIFLTQVLRTEKTVYVSTLVYSASVMLSYVIGYVIFHDSPSIVTVVGASLCVLSTICFIISKTND